MIRDAEIEQLLRDYTTPILRVAGLSQQNIQVVIINDKSFNAFVMDAHRIFVNSGAITQATTPNQIIGVLAHETGHIVGGHLSKMRQELANAQTAAIVAMLLGVGAMVAGAKSGSVDTGNIGAAAISAPQSYLVPTSARKRNRPIAPACVSCRRAGNPPRECTIPSRNSLTR